ncbi:hypothetical protein BU26DRAFT_214628 [Trematosphaeria pertusa]|uniref:Uncharacterized protein n=1 Tax=Trematosphaeria pertusa TaxID=390896 RepID=A0A6A6IU27_9PLEO|nr:uncharacterized protein BU26DRAFT_214628 [Trematosphaeria pertusa]KAF2253090.1 hypothetical protein BU26DRAFT_214628 [Trematosphaeria pertusa]
MSRYLEFPSDFWVEWPLHLVKALLIFSILFQAITVSCSDQKDLSSVSSLYGPGVFIPWLLTALPTLLSCEWQSLLVALSRRLRRIVHKQDLEYGIVGGKGDKAVKEKVDFDAGVLGTAAYPLVASIDVLRWIGGNADSPQRAAAVCVARVGAMVAFVAILGEWNQKENHRHEGFARATGRRRATWTMLWSICTFSSMATPAPGWFSMLMMLIWTWSYICVGTMATSLMNEGYRFETDDAWDMASLLLFWVFVVASLIAGMFMYTEEALPFKIGISFPRSGSSLLDQDQWFPLVCSMILVVFPVSRKAYRLFEERQHPIDAADGPARLQSDDQS